MDQLLTVKDLSKLLKINEKTIYRHTAEGKIPCLKIGGSIRFDKDAVFRVISDGDHEYRRGVFDYRRKVSESSLTSSEADYTRQAIHNVIEWKPIKKKYSDDKAIQVIDLFSGCGGMSLGFAALAKTNSAFRLIGAVDVNDASLESYATNFGVNVQNVSVADIASSKLVFGKFLEKLSDYDPDQPLVLIGCAPCQGFTAHRKKNWDEGDDRNNLIIAFTKVAKKLNPDCIIMENVPELLSHKYWEYFQYMSRELGKVGYTVKPQIHNLAEFGVPQERFRALIVAMKKDFLMPVGFLEHKQFRTTRDVIFDLPKLNAGECAANDQLHRAVSHKKSTIDVIRAVPKNGGSRPAGVGPSCLQSFNGFADVYGRLYWDRPSITITHYARNPASGRFVHPEQHRGLTMREAARLQSFPDGFIFKGKSDDIYRQIGEAVPPVFSAALASNVLANFRNEVVVREEILINDPVNNSYAGVIAGMKMGRK